MPTVTITDCERVLWSGTYKQFQAAYLESLSVTEFGALWDTGSLQVHRIDGPRLHIQLSRSTSN